MKKQNDILVFTGEQLKRLFLRRFPELTAMAVESGDAGSFRNNLERYISEHPNHRSKAADSLKRLIRNDRKTVFELSTEQHIEIQTISFFGNGSGRRKRNVNTDFILELYHQFELLTIRA